MKKSIEERFWEKVDKTETCWLWTAGLSRAGGYGKFRLNGKKISAHRFSWTLFNGEIPINMHVLHSCDTPTCVRPDHLFLGTHIDNMADRHNKGRDTPPDWRTRRRKVSRVSVLEIKQKFGTGEFTQKELAALYGVTPGNIWHIVRNRTWKRND